MPLYNLPRVPQHYAFVESLIGDPECTIGPDTVAACCPDPARCPDCSSDPGVRATRECTLLRTRSRWTTAAEQLNAYTPRPLRPGLTPDQLDSRAPQAEDQVCRARIYADACAALARAAREQSAPRARRRAEREAVFSTLEQHGLVRRTRGGRCPSRPSERKGITHHRAACPCSRSAHCCTPPMTDNGQLRVQAEPLQIFEIVLRSLEAHRPAKTETDILDRIRMRWNLSDTQAGAGGKNAVLEAWPGELVARGVKVDAFLSFVVEELGPFVEMLIELYSFLSEYVSTSGGRTEHFEIDSDALRESWAFDMSRLPKQVSWIQAWHASRVEYVAADLDNISRELLCIDNGIYYAKVGDKRALQSLIVARRDGYIPADVRRLGDQIRGAMLRVVRAYANSFGALDASAELGGRPSIRAFVPELHNLLAGRGFTTEPDLRNLVAIDPRVLEQSAPYRLEQVFLDLADDRPILTRDDKDYWSLSSLAFFCALWGLEEGDFRHAARLLTAHESRKDLFRPEEMAGAGLAAVRTLHAQVNEAIVITPSDQVVRTLRKQRLEVLLLPYWKDRWFLYEVWVLSHTLRYATRLGASVELAGVTEIARDGVVGSSWNLPTQKAQHPVAYMRGPTGSLAVWFQRETQRLDSAKHMEPDIRLMHETERDEDLLILEVKDRVKFSGSGRRVARSYLDGSRARAVWVLNYEPTASGGHTQIEELGFRRLGVIDGFRPGGAFPEFDEGLDATIGRYLGLPAEERFSQRVLIVDTSSSMAGKRLPILQLDPYLTDLIVVWSATVSGAPPEMREALKLGQRIPGVGGAERASALQNYLDTMRSNVGVTLITDCSGRRHLEEAGLITGQIPSSVMLCGRAAKLIEI